MYKSRLNKGQISVFLLIILLSVILLAGAVVDISRITAGEEQVKRAVDCAIDSVLAEYGTTLKEEYGIFALNKDEFELSYLVNTYIKKNLSVDKPVSCGDAVYLDLYGFRVEDIKVTPLFNLTENEIVRNQILEYMKYRAPKKMIENVWDKLSAVRGAGKMAEAYKKKLSVDKLLSGMGSFQEELKRSISGTIKDNLVEQFYVTGFNKNGSRDRVVKELSQIILECKYLQQLLEEQDREINCLEYKIKNEKDSKAKKALKDALDTAMKQRKETYKRLQDTQDNLDRVKSGLKYNHTQAYIDSNRKALESVHKIIEAGKKAGSAISRLEEYIKESFEETQSFSDAFTLSIGEDIGSYRDMILEGEKAVELVENLEGNIVCLENLLDKIEELDRRFSQPEGFTLSKDEIISLLNNGLSLYNKDMNYDYVKPVKAEGTEDPREEMAEAGRGSIEPTEGGDRDIVGAGIPIEELPSYKKKMSNSFDAEDQEFIGQGGEINDSYIEMDSSTEYGEEMNAFNHEIEFKNREAGFSDSAMGFLGGFADKLEDGLIGLRDELYINEYIIGTFKNSVPVLKNASDEAKDIDLRGVEKENRDTFFESEVEYILHGNSSEDTNRLLTKGQVLLIRFGMNALHVYTDRQKKLLAGSIASAVAGWWTAGAGIPLISNLIMCGWGMGEAVIDLNELMDGKSVPFYKTKGDWSLDIGLKPDDVIDETQNKANLLFSYHDYLRLLLLLKSPDEKINRIEDLIQLNIQKNKRGFTMADSSTYIRAEVTVSMKYFFLTPLFVPEDRKTADGRHRFRVLVYRGY